MSISSEISRISGNVSDALGAVSDMGGTVPSGANSDNLATLIRSIPLGSAKSAKISKITDYLYYYDIDFELDYDKAIAYVQEHGIVTGNCTAFRKGNFVGRNFDFPYDEKAEFIVSTKSLKGRHAVIGVSTGLAALTNTFADSGEWSDLYEIIPCAVTDGINDRGVFICMNAVDDGAQTFAEIDTGADLAIPLVMIPRYVLDYADSADHAILLLQGIDIIPPFDELPVALHFLIVDGDKTYVVEYVPDGSGGWEMVYYQFPDADNHMPVLTNFYLHDFFDDGTITGQGKNRYDAVVAAYAGIAGKQDFWDTLASVYSTKANEYTFPATRDGSIGHTMHSCVYDLAHKTFSIKPQPDVPIPTNEVYHFAVNGAIRNDGMSFDDLADRPFYELGEQINISLDDSDYDDVSAVSFDLTTNNYTHPAKLLRVADSMTREAARTAEIGVFSSGNTQRVSVSELLFNGVSDGFYYTGDGFPYMVVTRTDDVTITRAESDLSFSVTLPTAGTYLAKLSLGNLSAYVSALQTNVVKKLDEKYYDRGVMYVTCTLDPQTFSISNLSNNYQDIVDAINSNKVVKIKAGFYLSPTVYREMIGDLFLVGDVSDKFVSFGVLTTADIGGGLQLYHDIVTINENGSIDVEVRQIQTTQIV